MIKFGTGGWRDIIGNGFVERNVRIVAEGLFILMQNMKRATHPVIIGYDNRFLSKEAAVWMTEVLAYHNIKVEFINKPVPTPLIMYMVMDKGYDWGIAITASHNPAEYNGFKVYGEDGAQLNVAASNEVIKIINGISIPAKVPAPNTSRTVAIARSAMVKPRPIPIPSKIDLPTVFLPANISARPKIIQLTVISARKTPRLS